MNKKGFTLIELLSIIVILAVIALIATPRITDAINEAREKEYRIQENYISRAAMNYVAVNREYIPNAIGHINIIKLNELQSSNMIDEIFDSKDSSQKCDGYVYVEKDENVDLKTKSFLKCGSNYVTEGYIENAFFQVDFLVVAGGGGSGSGDRVGGGGAGGLIFAQKIVNEKINVINIGAGGTIENNGQNSSAFDYIAIGGGAGGCSSNSINCNDGKNGGSGGGAGNGSYWYNNIGTIIPGGLGTAKQGNAGGNSTYRTPYTGGGGGGAGSPGVDFNPTTNLNGNGGDGLYFGDKFGTSFGQEGWFAGGGGGGWYGISGGFGGRGGGGNSKSASVLVSQPGMPNTGGGAAGRGGSGGSGIVLIRYSGSQKATGGTVISVNGYTIHAFIEVGTHTFEVLDF
ncbi:MAG: type II secretion system protein [Bacilli bacterium]|nr:type II secretion system protein [Bacilli bacterium]MDD4734046.1 type II secretion system protein [Bacilli bacterium]